MIEITIQLMTGKYIFQFLPSISISPGSRDIPIFPKRIIIPPIIEITIPVIKIYFPNCCGSKSVIKVISWIQGEEGEMTCFTVPYIS